MDYDDIFDTCNFIRR